MSLSETNIELMFGTVRRPTDKLTARANASLKTIGRADSAAVSSQCICAVCFISAGDVDVCRLGNNGRVDRTATPGVVGGDGLPLADTEHLAAGQRCSARAVDDDVITTGLEAFHGLLGRLSGRSGSGDAPEERAGGQRAGG